MLAIMGKRGCACKLKDNYTNIYDELITTKTCITQQELMHIYSDVCLQKHALLIQNLIQK